MNIQVIIENLNRFKKQRGLTLKQLAERAELSLGTVNKIMSGAVSDIKTDKLQKLCAALGVSTERVLCSDFNVEAHEPTASFFGLMKIACVSPEVRVADCAFNAQRIVESARLAASEGAKIVLFPELCITAYTCGDLFFQRTLKTAALEGLKYVCDNLRNLDAVFVVGLPLCDNSGKLFNVAAVVFRGEVLGIVPKTHLPNYNEFFEKRLFTPAAEANSSVTLFGKEVPFGTKIIFENTAHREIRFAVEICEDIWVADSPSFGHASAGANLILNLSASNEIVCKAEYRAKMVEIQSAKSGTVYAYCSSGEGESTSDTVFSAHNIICENGTKIAESKPFGSGFAIAEADFDFIENERAKLLHTQNAENYLFVPFHLPISDAPTRVYGRLPFVPSDKKTLAERCEMVLNLQAHALKKRILHTKAEKLVLGVSGGSDSTLALLVCKRTMQLLSRSCNDIIAITMPCFGTTARTLKNSLALAEAIGATVRKIDVTAAVTQHLKDIGHDLSVADTTFENAQARERTQVLMDVANAENGLVVGTGDMSELALGWATYNGDHMSMYAVNGSVPKTLVRALIAHEASKSNAVLREILLDVLATPISPELLPQKEGISQITEDIVGPYELHDYFLYMLVRKSFAPAKIFALAKLSFEGIYDEQTIFKWLEKFVKRFFTQQFKRSCQPDGVRIGTVDISKNSWRMPSDACFESWLKDLESVAPQKVTK